MIRPHYKINYIKNIEISSNEGVTENVKNEEMEDEENHRGTKYCTENK